MRDIWDVENYIVRNMERLSYDVFEYPEEFESRKKIYDLNLEMLNIIHHYNLSVNYDKAWQRLKFFVSSNIKQLEKENSDGSEDSKIDNLKHIFLFMISNPPKNEEYGTVEDAMPAFD